MTYSKVLHQRYNPKMEQLGQESEIISEVHYWWQVQEQIEWCAICEKHTTKTKHLEEVKN